MISRSSCPRATSSLASSIGVAHPSNPRHLLYTLVAVSGFVQEPCAVPWSPRSGGKAWPRRCRRFLLSTIGIAAAFTAGAATNGDANKAAPAPKSAAACHHTCWIGALLYLMTNSGNMAARKRRGQKSGNTRTEWQGAVVSRRTEQSVGGNQTNKRSFHSFHFTEDLFTWGPRPRQAIIPGHQ